MDEHIIMGPKVRHRLLDKPNLGFFTKTPTNSAHQSASCSTGDGEVQHRPGHSAKDLYTNFPDGKFKKGLVAIGAALGAFQLCGQAAQEDWVRARLGGTAVLACLVGWQGPRCPHSIHPLLIDAELVLPTIRSAVEKQLNLIAQGKADYHQVLGHTLDIFKRKFHYFVDSIAGKTCLFPASAAIPTGQSHLRPTPDLGSEPLPVIAEMPPL